MIAAANPGLAPDRTGGGTIEFDSSVRNVKYLSDTYITSFLLLAHHYIFSPPLSFTLIKKTSIFLRICKDLTKRRIIFVVFVMLL